MREVGLYFGRSVSWVIGRGLEVWVLDSALWSGGFDPRTEHGRS